MMRQAIARSVVFAWMVSGCAGAHRPASGGPADSGTLNSYAPEAAPSEESVRLDGVPTDDRAEIASTDGRSAEPSAEPSAEDEEATARDFGGLEADGDTKADRAPAVPPAPPRAKKTETESRTAGKVAGGRDDEGSSPSEGSGSASVVAPSIKAGRHDDNKQYNRFLSFLGENQHLVVHPVDVSERLVIRLVDENEKSLPNCKVEVQTTSGKVLSHSVTYADGRTQFFPAASSEAHAKDFVVRATCGSQTRSGQLSRSGKREVALHFPFARKVPKPLPVDIAVVLDTTGSMGSQIARLKKTLEAIHFQLSNLPTKPDVRFGLVAYRDRGDDYVTQVTQFTKNVDDFQRVLNKLDADGGGDTPEDLQEALDDAMHKLDWRSDALRLGFTVSDAIPHTDYDQKFNYRDAMQEALGRGIKWATVGAGGLGRDGEVIFRQIAQYTMGEYVFITQGSAGNSEGGVGEASHHVGSNYTTENLDQAMVRIVKREISYMTDVPRDFDDTIVATSNDKKIPRDKVMAPAVAEVLRQLADYSAIQLKPGTPVAVVPVGTEKGHEDVGEYITEQMIFAASRNRAFKVLERDMSKIGQELKLQISDLFDAENTVGVGKMVGAELLIVAKLQVHEKGATLFAKMVRVETGEILSVAKVDMNTNVLKSS